MRLCKTCKTCKKNKRNTSFYIAYRYNDKPIYMTECKKCSIKTSTKWGKNNPASRKSSIIKHVYGIDLEAYNQILARQGGRCAICDATENPPRKHFDIDHRHSDSKVRGLLCHKCNIGLGAFRDNTVFLSNAISYLEDSCVSA